MNPPGAPSPKSAKPKPLPPKSGVQPFPTDTPPTGPAAAHGALPGPSNSVVTTTGTSSYGSGGVSAERNERWLAAAQAAAGNSPRAGAAVRLARWLHSTGRALDQLAGLELAADLLGPEEEEACRTLESLLDDGWSGSLGELLACARSL